MTQTIENAPCRDTENSDWETKRATFNRLDAELQPRNKTALFDALEAAGIATVAVSFDATATPDRSRISKSKAARRACLTESECSIISVADAVERVVYDCLEQAHCGWEDNEGAYGEFTFDVVNRKIMLDYNERYTGSHNSRHQF
jgi:hypothetical protein